MYRGVFVTGTDTGVGKTVAAAALVHRYRGSTPDVDAAPIRYWKPIQTGIEQDDDTATVRRLGCHGDEVLEEGVRLPRPLSPHLAARLNGRTIVLQQLVDMLAAQASPGRWVVEGAGGVLVPVNSTDLMVDLMTRLALPVLVVARTTLGTINHTLLTIEAIRARSLTIAGVLLVGERNRENREAIEGFGRVTVVGELPILNPLTPDTLGRWAAAELDRDGRLAELLE